MVSVVLYLANRAIFAVAPEWSNDFMRWYFNDLLVVPVMIPPILACSTVLGLRIKGEPPRLWEVAIPVVIWALAFELVGPVIFDRGIADVWDAVAYAISGILSYAVWRRPRSAIA